ncbi:class A beta-lactamase [Rhizobium wuzhouense]|uniref:Beta-lactamase n=1 Tax=Rhizobium wuzhouense TaxID=1986026 RepID=A0ABX5P0A2_9HYPH|nr:class A beta-lactamase [Rhizobium wuzhouense]PYB77038.1 SCO family class A beta-lactamase [Rhizobium wuzhouense]
MKLPLLLCLNLSLLLPAMGASPLAAAEGPITAAARQVESRLGARLGLMVVDTETNRQWQYRSGERFAMASTFKALACAALLDAGTQLLSRDIKIEAKDLLAHAPVTSKRVGTRMTAGDLCAATLSTSDNTAANLVLSTLGGPKRVNAFLRSIGDTVTRLDRMEPALNEATPGDPRDTTTPEAMARTIGELLIGDGLAPLARRQLTRWMEANAVADGLLRAGVPRDWRIADRTGAGGHGTRGIVAVMWPPGKKPVVAAIYLTETEASLATRDAAIAELGRVLAVEVVR